MPDAAAEPANARETSGITISLIVRHVRARAGEDGLRRLLETANVSLSRADLDGESGWCSYKEKIALFEAACAVLGDPAAARHIGETVIEHRVGLALKLLLRALGSPRQVVRNIARTSPKFSAVCTMEAYDVQRNRAVVTYRLHEGHTPSRHDCEYNIGLLSQIAPLFGLPAAVVVHDDCQVRGADCCVYRISWNRRRRFGWGRHTRSRLEVLEDQLRTVTEQSLALQSTIADLVSGDELRNVLARVATRAGTAVRATQYLLAVRPTEDAGLSIHADGLDRRSARRLADELLAEQPDEPDGSRLVVDVASARRHYGKLAALNPPGLVFFPEERVLLAAYARHAAAALDAATALADARERGDTASVLLELARALAGMTIPVETAQRIADAAPRIVGGRRSVVGVWDADKETLVVRAACGFAPQMAQNINQLSIRRGDTQLLDLMVRHPKARWYGQNEVDDFVRAVLSSFDSQGIYATPVVSRGDFLGLICIDNGANQPALEVTPAMSARMAGLADQAATALDNARLTEAQSRIMEELRVSEARNRHLATHDGLTGLPNRMLLVDRIGRAVATARRHRHRLGVLFLDIDHFKRVNDVLGHDVGDDLLRVVAERLSAGLREEDTLGRLGGDEFVVLLPRIQSPSDAEAVAAKIIAAFRRPFAVQGHELDLTTSVGVALFPEDGDDTASLLRAADVAMYRAKDAGRDRYSLQSGTPASPRIHLHFDGEETPAAG